MAFTLGATPEKMVVDLSPGADFIATIRTADGSNWDAGLAIELRFANSVVWPATIVADEARWNVDKADVDIVADDGEARRGRVHLFYIDGAVDAMWAAGQVDING